MKFQSYLLSLFFILSYFIITAQEVVVITDGDLVGGQVHNWTNDNIYIIDGYVFLEEGGTLNIEAGTIIKGSSNPEIDNASALIIARGAQIFAIGTPSDPIIFTAEADDLNDPNDMIVEGGQGVTDRGSWGGLIILGNSIVGASGRTGEAGIEGIPGEDVRGLYGGTDRGDNSGELRFVSIRYGGADLSSGNEINGLTLGGVGAGTTIEYIEVFGNADDGVEIFGGTVDLRFIVSAFNGDDMFDTDQSWAGRAQFLFGIQLPNDGLGNQQFGGEHDGSESEDLLPQTLQRVYNATFIGAGPQNASTNGERNTALLIRNDARIEYTNSIFFEFGTDALSIQDNSINEYLADEFQLRNNIWFGFGNGNRETFDSIVVSDDQTGAVIDKLLSEGNEVIDPQFTSISRSRNGMLNPRPEIGSPAGESIATPGDEWFTATAFRGAFPIDTLCPLWASSWTGLDQEGYLEDIVELSDMTFECNLQRLCYEAGFQQEFLDLVEEQRAATDRLIESGSVLNSNIITIPVVVHVLDFPAPNDANLSDSEILQQIDILNNHFRKADTTYIDSGDGPVEYKRRAADTRIQFQLARRTASCETPIDTNGITRKIVTGISEFDYTLCYRFFGLNDPVKNASMGGQDAWDPSQYLNIWVTNIGGAINGYSTIPADYASGNMDEDGIVIDFNAFYPGASPTDQGKFLIRLVAEWLGLYPSAGIVGRCDIDDEVFDTPSQSANENCAFMDTCPGDPDSDYWSYVQQFNGWIYGKLSSFFYSRAGRVYDGNFTNCSLFPPIFKRGLPTIRSYNRWDCTLLG